MPTKTRTLDKAARCPWYFGKELFPGRTKKKASEPEGPEAVIPVISLAALLYGDTETASGGTRQHQNASLEASSRYSRSMIKKDAFYRTKPGPDLGFLLFFMPGKGAKSQYHRGTRGGAGTVPPCACTSRWHCSATLPTCGNVREEQPLAPQSNPGAIPPKTMPALAAENNQQLNGIMSMTCANVL